MEIIPVVKIALFVPFILVFAITAVVYLIKGFKKDFGKALISFAATIISVCASMLLSKIFGNVLSGAVTSLFPEEVTGALSQFGTVGTELVEGAIGIVISFILFGIIFLICMAVFKAIGRKIDWYKPEELTEEKPALKIASMAIRGVDALLITTMLLLPIYGTVAMAAPSAVSVMRLGESFSQMWTNGVNTEQYLTEPEVPEESISSVDEEEAAEVVAAADFEETMSVYSEPEVISEIAVTPEMPEEIIDSEIVDAFEAVAKNPVLALYKFGPGDWVFSGLSSFSVNGNKIDIASIVDALEKIFSLLQEYREAVIDGDSDEAMKVIEEFVKFAEKKVIRKKWSYSLIMTLADGLGAMAEAQADAAGEGEEFAEMYDELKPLLDMTYEEYTQNAEGILNFAKCFIEIYGKYSDRDLSEDEASSMKTELCEGIGELLNYSDQIVSIKRTLLQRYAQVMFDTLPDKDNPTYASYYAARKKLPDTGAEFVNKYFGDGIVPEKYRTQEAMAFLSMMDSSDALDMAEAFVRHPLFGAKAVLDSTDEYLYIIGCGSLGTQLAASENAQNTYKAFDKMLEDCENAPVSQPLTFSESVHNYLTETLGFSDIYDENVSIMMFGEDGKVYRIPEELNGIITSPLDEETIIKYGLQPVENNSDDTFVAMTP